MIGKLRKRFIGTSMAAFAVVMLLLCLIVNMANYISIDGELRSMLRTITDNSGSIPGPRRDSAPPEKLNGQFTPETPFNTRYFVLRFTESGELVKADLDMIAAVTEDDVAQYISTALENGVGYGRTGEYRFLVESSGDGRMMAVFLDCYRETRNIRNFALYSLMAMLICDALVFVILLLCSKKAIEPIIRSNEQQKQFITDAGHELKTPLTVIATDLKLLEMENGSSEWIDKARVQTEKLNTLISELIDFSRMEEGRKVKPESFCLSDSVFETVASFEDFAAEKGHTLTIDIEPQIEYFGDEYSVRRLCTILVDNAIKYAVPGTEIFFSLKKTKKGAVITTVNECEHMEKNETAKLFDRFYRADKSRSSERGGFGIGLSAARKIAENHKGFIKAECENGHTITFTAELR